MDRLTAMRLEKDLRDLAVKWSDLAKQKPTDWCEACGATSTGESLPDYARELDTITRRYFGPPLEPVAELVLTHPPRGT